MGTEDVDDFSYWKAIKEETLGTGNTIMAVGTIAAIIAIMIIMMGEVGLESATQTLKTDGTSNGLISLASKVSLEQNILMFEGGEKITIDNAEAIIIKKIDGTSFKFDYSFKLKDLNEKSRIIIEGSNIKDNGVVVSFGDKTLDYSDILNNSFNVERAIEKDKITLIVYRDWNAENKKIGDEIVVDPTIGYSLDYGANQDDSNNILINSTGGKHFIWSGSNRLYHSNSSDGGATWSNHTIYSGGIGTVSCQLYSNETIACFYIETVGNERINYTYSINGGVTWSSPVASGYIAPNGRPLSTTTNGSSLYGAYTGGGVSAGYDGLMIIKTDNNGGTFTAKNITTKAYTSPYYTTYSHPVFLINSSGTLHLISYNSTANRLNHLVDTGSFFTSYTSTLFDVAWAADVPPAPIKAVMGNETGTNIVHLIYTNVTAGANNQRIMYRNSSTNWASPGYYVFQSPMNISTSLIYSRRQSDISIESYGYPVVIAFLNRTSSTTGLFIANTTNGGSTFTNTTLATHLAYPFWCKINKQMLPSFQGLTYSDIYFMNSSVGLVEYTNYTWTATPPPVAPVMLTATLDPSGSALSSSILRCYGNASDADNSTWYGYYELWRNGAVVASGGPIGPNTNNTNSLLYTYGGAIVASDQFQCSILASDLALNSSWLNSTNTTIADFTVASESHNATAIETVPQIYNLSIQFSTGIENITATVNYSGTSYPSYLNGSNSSHANYTAYISPSLVPANATTNSFNWSLSYSAVNGSTMSYTFTTYTQDIYYGYYISAIPANATHLEGDAILLEANITNALYSNVTLYSTLNSNSYSLTPVNALQYDYLATAPSQSASNFTIYPANYSLSVHYGLTTYYRPFIPVTNYTVYKLILDYCTGGLTTDNSTNLTIRDFDSGNLTLGNIIAYYNVSNGAASQAYSFSWTNVSSVEICIYPLFGSFSSVAQIQYGASGYQTRHTTISETLSNATIYHTLYLSSGVVVTIFTLTDQYLIPLEAYTIRTAEFSILNGSFTNLTDITTDSNGNANEFLTPYTQTYQFTIIKDGVVIYTFTPQTINVCTGTTSCTVQLTIPGTSVSPFTYIYGSITANCTNYSIANHQWLYCSVYDAQNLSDSTQLLIQQQTRFFNGTTCSYSVAQTPVMILSCDLGNATSGRAYTYNVLAEKDSNTYIITTGELNYVTPVNFAMIGVLLSLFLGVTLFFIGIWNPIASLGLLALAYLGGFAFGLFSFSQPLPVLMPVVSVGIMLVAKIFLMRNQ